ncbi:MAG: hypothetical protein JNK14_09750 [Chitinophagaceae bacterium]|nr:hypothetical protein [Chitinophagaceae bacterium]
MKIDREKSFLAIKNSSEEKYYSLAIKDIKDAIAKVTWPLKSKKFTINPTRMGNGVKPIKNEFVTFLKSKGWKTEISIKLIDQLNAGPIDALLETKAGSIAVEWETGNISSSHRALNKMALAILQENIIGGFLIIPIRNLAKYLTDRIGNYEEIEPYFQLWQNVSIKKGVLGIIGVDYDDISTKVSLIPKGSDGNSKNKKREKRK